MTFRGAEQWQNDAAVMQQMTLSAR